MSSEKHVTVIDAGKCQPSKPMTNMSKRKACYKVF